MVRRILPSGGGFSRRPYIYAAGDGNDTIHTYDTGSASVDIARFEGRSIEDLWLTREGSTLRIRVVGTDDQVAISNWYAGEAYQLDRIEVGGGQVLARSNVDQLVQAMSAFAAPTGAGSTVTPDARTALQPILAASWQRESVAA